MIYRCMGDGWFLVNFFRGKTIQPLHSHTHTHTQPSTGTYTNTQQLVDEVDFLFFGHPQKTPVSIATVGIHVTSVELGCKLLCHVTSVELYF